MQLKTFSNFTSTAGPTNILALMFFVLFTITACGTTSPPPPAQVNTTTSVQEGVPGGITVNSVEVTAKVTAIDAENRKVTLLLPNEEKETVKAPPEVVAEQRVRLAELQGTRDKLSVAREQLAAM